MAYSEGHDAPRLIDELIPCLAAVIDEIVVSCKNAVGEPVVAHELPDVFHWVELGGFRGMARMVMLGGMTRRVDMCQPA